MKGEAPIKVEISVPEEAFRDSREVVQVFKEIQEQPGKIMEMICGELWGSI